MIFVTGNKKKLAETELILGMKLEQRDLDPPEIQADDCVEVVQASAEWLLPFVGEPFIHEDASFHIHALKGFPGAYFKHVMQTIGNEGVLKLMEGIEDRKATARLAIAYYDGEKIRVFVGEVEGKIATEIRGPQEFGWDPIFIPEGREKTFAEDMEYKHEVSHRRKALEKLREIVYK